MVDFKDDWKVPELSDELIIFDETGRSSSRHSSRIQVGKGSVEPDVVCICRIIYVLLYYHRDKTFVM